MTAPIEPLAIIGMACRFPNGLDSVDALWAGLTSRFCAIGPIPPDRWTTDRYYSSNEGAKGKTYIQRGGFLKQDISGFDATFFGISPRDAENMDPQQRLMLEVVWEAFENAGAPATDYAGRKVGVYVGGFMLDHMITQMSPANRSQINQHTAAGMMMTMLSNRVSHTYDFRGPSLSIDTACSSSLVAFHYACQDVWRGDCEMAVVGGVNVMTRPENPMGMCKGHFLSRDGECKSFDARGDGYGRGEGAAAVIVKPLSRALADGDLILATVIGAGTNQDGRTPGISMPSGEAQEALIRDVCERYAIDPRRVRYVECHGTGTAIGDPTEATAVGSTYGVARKDLGPVVVGSIKSNIGHLEAGAGVAGVVKATLTLMNRMATPLANLKEPNPGINCEELNLRIASEAIPFEDDGQPLCVAINSFGYGGSNAHVILQAYEGAAKKPHANGSLNGRPHNLEPDSGRQRCLPISARSAPALAEFAQRFADTLRTDVSLDDVLYTASQKRAHLSHRAVVTGSNREELIAGLEALAKGEASNAVITGSTPFQGRPEPVFVFTGMGPQWWAMGQELYRTDAVYRGAVDEAEAAFQSVAGFSILAEMNKSEAESQITRTELAQPANLVVQIGLLASLKASGLTPGAVVGHSVGELGAAYAAGVLSLREVMTVSFHRSRLQAQCAGMGGMLAVGISLAKAEAIIANYNGSVSIAAVNAPKSVTLAGDVDALAAIAEKLQQQNIFNRVLDVEVPYHSPAMDPIMDPLREALRGVSPQPPNLPLYSTVTGGRVEGIAYGADYWPLNVRQPVYFAQAIRELLAAGFHAFVEVGPHPVLSASLKECFKESGTDGRTIQTLRRNTSELHAGLKAAMSAYAAGAAVDWTIHNARGRQVGLPNYPWQREYHWMENDRAKQDRIGRLDHPMLGFQEAPGSPVWRQDFDFEDANYLRQHVVKGLPILPAAGYLESMLELARIQFEDAPGAAVRRFTIHAPMVITLERGLDAVTSYEPINQTALIRSLENGRLGTGQINATAKICPLPRFQPAARDVSLWQAECPGVVEIKDLYDRLAAIGLAYGPAFQTVRALSVNVAAGKAVARVEVAPELTAKLSTFCLHPTLLDGCFQSLLGMLEKSSASYLPTGIKELAVYRRESPAAVWCLCELVSRTERELTCHLTLVDDDGAVVAAIRSMTLKAAAKRELTDRFGDPVKRQILAYQWNYVEEVAEPKRLGHWLVVSDSDGVADAVVERIEAFGATVVGRVHYGAEASREGRSFAVRPGNRDDLAAMLAECGELDGVAYFDSLGATAESDDPTGEEALARLITFTQALDGAPTTRRPRVYVVTRSACSVSPYDAPVTPPQSTLNGFCRVAYNELDGFRFSTVDVEGPVGPEQIAAIATELLADDRFDEVALRSGARLASELVDSPVLHEDLVEYRPLDDDHPVLIRGAAPDANIVGTVKVVETYPSAVGPDEVELRIDATLVPVDLLTNVAADVMKHPWIDVTAMVLSAGENIGDLRAGDIVCGLIPSDLSSHRILPRRVMHVVALPQGIDAANAASVVGTAACAQYAADRVRLPVDARVAVQATAKGRAVGAALARAGATVVYLSESDAQGAGDDGCEIATYSCCPEGLSRAVDECTGGVGFDALAVGAAAWSTRFDLRAIRPGGALIDLDDSAEPAPIDPHVSTVVRTDLRLLTENAADLAAAMSASLAAMAAGELSVEPFMEVTIADLAWQKLPIAAAKSTLVMTFATHGKDLPVVRAPRLRFCGDGQFIVTGGFGGLGRKTAEWLVAHGVRHLLLTGRTGVDNDDKRAFVERLQSMGAIVSAVACDTADFARLQTVWREAEASGPPIRGVFHSGAVILDQPIPEIDRATLAQVMRSKALGAWNLHLLSLESQLDHFVLYSSLANLVGNSRQGAYCAANGYLNGLAAYRRAMGLPGVSVNWGAIADVGVVAQDERLEQFLRYTGLRGIPADDALMHLRDALAREVGQFGITYISSWADWARFEVRGATSPRFATVIAADSQGREDSTRDALVQELIKLDRADQVELLSELIREILASVLKSDPAAVPLDRSINQLGVDSLMATEIQMLLDSRLGLNVSILELIGDSTVRSLAAQGVKSLCGDGGLESPPSAVPPVAPRESAPSVSAS